jgi:hypothetical protein
MGMEKANANWPTPAGASLARPGAWAKVNQSETAHPEPDGVRAVYRPNSTARSRERIAEDCTQEYSA